MRRLDRGAALQAPTRVGALYCDDHRDDQRRDQPECPVEAIKPDTEPSLEKWLGVNAEYAKIWPNITTKKTPPADAKQWEGVPNKFEEHFSANPGGGD